MKKVDKSLVRETSQDPFAILLSKLTGIDKKPSKLLSGWQHWSKHNFKRYKDQFEEHFKASGKSEKEWASVQQSYIRDLFNRLLEDEQAEQNQAAIDEHTATQKALKEKKDVGPSEDPEDRQR